MLVAYLAHPRGDSDESRGNEASNALRWFQFLVRITQWAVTVPWWIYDVGLSSIFEERRQRDQLGSLERCDILVLVGGLIDEEMHQAIKLAHRAGMPVLDLTMMGVTPPSADEDVAITITNRAGRLMQTRARRIWMPLLSLHDLESLKEARHALYTHYNSAELEMPVAILDRIISAAFDTGVG